MNYKLIDKNDEWVCMDATDIVKEAKDKDYSNVFIDWLGQDLDGKSFPIDCYRGLSPLQYCGGNNPAGADDCRPYLKLTYK